MTFDPTITINTIINAGVGAILTAIGWGLRRAVHDVTAFISRVQKFDERIEDTADVVDLHSEVLARTGWAKGQHFRTVSQKRRTGDHAEGV